MRQGIGMPVLSGISPKPRRIVFVASLLSIVVSFLLPDMVSPDAETPINGLYLLSLGWLAPLTGTPQFAWFANPLLLLAVVLRLLKRRIATLVSAALAGLLSLDTFLVPGQRFLLNEAGMHTRYALGLGAYLWVAGVIGIAVLLSEEALRSIPAAKPVSAPLSSSSPSWAPPKRAKTLKTLPRWAIGISLGIFCLSFAYPVLHDPVVPTESFSALKLFLFGWMGPLYHPLQLGWYANPFYFGAILLRLKGKRPQATWAAGIAASLALETFFVPGSMPAVDEGLRRNSYVLDDGAYDWAIAIGFLFAAFAWEALTRPGSGPHAAAGTPPTPPSPAPPRP
jgi:hypothetical protein